MQKEVQFAVTGVEVEDWLAACKCKMPGISVAQAGQEQGRR